jgi:hypothetical protein
MLHGGANDTLAIVVFNAVQQAHRALVRDQRLNGGVISDHGR